MTTPFSAERSELLPGEDPQSASVGDADHWTAVYSELIAFCTQLLRSGSLEDNLTALAGHRRKLQRRLTFWHSRQVKNRLNR